MDFSEFFKELEAEFFGAGAKLMGLQLLQLELKLGKSFSSSFMPVKSAEILCPFWTSYLLRVSRAQEAACYSTSDLIKVDRIEKAACLLNMVPTKNVSKTPSGFGMGRLPLSLN
ncbi:hypothetical protein Tco_1476080 [Tanacetum coccineum]